jgi:hypothetical protein
MDLPITNVTWPQLLLGLWLIPLALNLAVYAPRLAAELFADVQRARQGSYTTTSYADVLLALVVSSIPLINVIALIFDAFPYALKRFGRFVGFVGDVLSKPIVPRSKVAPPPRVHAGHHIFTDTRRVLVENEYGVLVAVMCDENWEPPADTPLHIAEKVRAAVASSWSDIKRIERLDSASKAKE